LEIQKPVQFYIHKKLVPRLKTFDIINPKYPLFDENPLQTVDFEILNMASYNEEVFIQADFSQMNYNASI
jgi:hypothetical protein